MKKYEVFCDTLTVNEGRNYTKKKNNPTWFYLGQRFILADSPQEAINKAKMMLKKHFASQNVKCLIKGEAVVLYLRKKYEKRYYNFSYAVHPVSVSDIEADVEHSPFQFSLSEILDAEKELNDEYQDASEYCVFGDEFSMYLFTYGCLLYKDIYFLGLTKNNRARNNIVTATKFLWETNKKAKEFFLVVIEVRENGKFAVVDGYDNVFIVNKHNENIYDIEMKLYDYIIYRFLGGK